MEEDLAVNKTVSINGRELRFRATGSGGPGGQHANTANTKVELTFNVLRSNSLGPRQKQRIIDKLGEVVRISASDRRSQTQNRELARQRLANKLANALKITKSRTATRPTKGSKERRLQEKKQRSSVKSYRRRVIDDD